MVINVHKIIYFKFIIHKVKDLMTKYLRHGWYRNYVYFQQVNVFVVIYC